MAYDAGEAFLRIVPSFDGVIERINAQAARWGVSSGRTYSENFNREVRRRTDIPVGPSQEQSRRQGQQTGRTFADSFKARVEAALRSLPDIQINADSTAAEVRIARLRTNLEALRDQRVGIDIDTATALASVENIKRQIEEVNRESPDVAVRIDTARASAELARIQAEVDALRTEDPQVDVEVDDHGSAERTAAHVNALRASLVALSPIAIPIGAALVGGLAGAAATFGAVAAGAGALVLGLSGVSKATQLLGQRQQAANQSTGGGANSARQAAAAERGLADARYNAAQQAITSAERVKQARQSLADTERRLARQEAQDARDVTAAQRDLVAAQQAVNDARQQAARDLQASANDAADAGLSQRQAVLDLADAQATLESVNADGSKTDAEKQQAALDVEKAQQALLEANQRLTTATADNTKAQKAGVDGASAVLTAVQRQRDAVDALRLARARQRQDAADGARDVVRAELQVKDALREQANQARQSAEAILSAEDAVASAMESTGSAGNQQLQKINDQLAKVSPATLAFARFVRNQLEPAVAKLKATASAGLLPGVERGLKALRPLFGPFNRLVGTLSRTLGGLATEAGRALSGPFWRQFLDFVNRNAGPMLTTFGRIVGNVAKGFAGLAEAFQPVTNLIGGVLLRLARKFADFGAGATKNKGFQAFLSYLKENGPIVAQAIGRIVTIFGHLAKALAPLGAVLIRVVDALAGFLANLSPDQLLLLVGVIAGLVALIGGPFIAVIVAITAGAALLARNWDKFKGILEPLIAALKGAALKAFEGIRAAVERVTDAVKSHSKQFKELFGFIVKYVVPVIGTALKIAFQVAGFWISVFIDAIALLVDVIAGLISAGKAVGQWFAGPFVDFFRTAWRDVVSVWGSIKTAFRLAWEWVRDTFSSLWRRVTRVVSEPVNAARSAIGAAWSTIRTGFRSAWEWVRDTFAGVWGRATAIITAPIDAAKTAIGKVWGGIKTGASEFVAGIKTIWDGLKEIFKSPIKFLITTVLNHGLIHAWNVIASKIPGVDITIDDVPLPKGFATGGIYPGYTPGRDVGLAAVSGGEAIMRPEWTRAVGPGYVHAANAAARSGGESGVRQFLGGFADGGIIPSFAAGGIANPANWVEWFKDKIKGPLDAMKKFGGTDVGKIIVGMPAGLAKGMIDAIKDLASQALASVVNIGTGLAAPILGGRVTVGGTVGGGPTLVDPAANQNLGRRLAAQLGWNTGPSWADLVALWTRESGWSQIADTRVSGLDPANATEFAYGIAQARPASKYPLAGRPFDLGGRSDAATQIAWGLNYISGRYGSPVGAWAHELAYNWYDQGGLLPAGPSLVYNGTGQAELVAPRQTFEQLMNASTAKGYDNGPLVNIERLEQRPNEDSYSFAQRVSGQLDFKIRAGGGRR